MLKDIKQKFEFRFANLTGKINFFSYFPQTVIWSSTFITNWRRFDIFLMWYSVFNIYKIPLLLDFHIDEAILGAIEPGTISSGIINVTDESIIGKWSGHPDCNYCWASIPFLKLLWVLQLSITVVIRLLFGFSIWITSIENPTVRHKRLAN